MAVRGSDKLVYPKIYVMQYRPSSGCEHFKVVEKEGGYVARCLVLDRYLVKYEVTKCEKYWQLCPFRRFALRLE